MSPNLDDLRRELEMQAGSAPAIDPFAEVAAILEALPDRTRFLNTLLATARRSFFADHGAILSHHRLTGRWFAEASYELDNSAIEEIKGLSWTVVRETSETAQSLLVSDARTHEITRNSGSVRAYNIQSVLCAPIFDSQGVWGVIYLDNSGVPNAFDEESREQLRLFARFCGIAIQRCDDLVRLSGPVVATIPDDHAPSAAAFFDFISPPMVEIMNTLQRAAPTDVPILLVGETGTGKDYLARWIHANSPRRERAFAHVNCASIHANLVEAELFGIESNVATGVGFREGRIKLADGGTVFLNEIGELPLSLQAKILRVIENKELDRVGGDTAVGVDVRFICATHRDLSAMVEQGEFRRDLYYRINIFEAHLPPLRDRMEDFPGLADHILKEKCRQYGRPPMRLSEAVMARWATEKWPGNLRELANVIERGIILGEGSDLATESRKAGRSRQISLPSSAHSGESLTQLMEQTEAQIITQALRDSGWMPARAAARLRLPSSTLRYKMSKLGIKPPKRVR
jgi:transcriptional regulator with GAF, ATPase, and Fis domain